MNIDIIISYLESKIIWKNKDSTPCVRIIDVLYLDEWVKVKYEILFKTNGSNILNKYLTSASCSIKINDIKDFIRERNLSLLI